MINNKWLQKIFAVLTVLVFLTGFSVMTAYADPGDDGGESVADDGGEIDGEDNNDSGNDDSSSQPDDSSSSSVSEQSGVDNDTDNDDGDNDGGSSSSSVAIPEQIDDLRRKYLGDDDDDDTDTEESESQPNENLDNLPTVAKEEVTAATAEPLPDVEVSDATLFSGIVMWVCVAVGISVVVGVMVSKRTHRRGP